MGEKGRDSRGTNYTQILGQAVELQGKLQAKQLLVSSGQQNVNYANEQVKSLTSKDYTAPTVGIDTAKLGGMYANHIRLIANDKGAGVNNAGTIQANNMLFVDSSGKIENRGTLQAKDKLTLKTVHTDKNGDILFHANSKMTGSADILVMTGGNISLNQSQITQTQHSQYTDTALNFIGKQIHLMGGKIHSPNNITFTATQNHIQIDPQTISEKGVLKSELEKNKAQLAKLKKEDEKLSLKINALEKNRRYSALSICRYSREKYHLECR